MSTSGLGAVAGPAEEHRGMAAAFTDRVRGVSASARDNLLLAFIGREP